MSAADNIAIERFCYVASRIEIRISGKENLT
jgi:hypothetical protein